MTLQSSLMRKYKIKGNLTPYITSVKKPLKYIYIYQAYKHKYSGPSQQVDSVGITLNAAIWWTV